MDIVWPTITTESKALTSMEKYYRDMFTSRSYILDPLAEASIGP